jgi:hypothetical protein
MTEYYRHQKMIANILNEFDFERVHKVMVVLRWKWIGAGRVPSIEELKLSARQRIDDAIKGCLKYGSQNEEYWVTSGGLRATVLKNENEKINFIKLEFVLANWETNDMEIFENNLVI